MSASATVTAKTGPAQQDTSSAVSGVTAIVFDYARSVIQIFKGNVNTYPYQEFDMVGVTTISDTISNGNHTIVIS